MHSSTSSSERRRPRARWVAIATGALLLVLGAIVALEAALATRGFHASAQEAEFAWQRERRRAARLGAHALVVVGSSRAQLDLDLDELAARTGLEPVQLAIDGNTYLPVLEDLAADPAIRATVLVEYGDAPSATGADASDGRAEAWTRRYHRLPRWWPWTYDYVEGVLGERWRGALRAYADGARPLTSLTDRVLSDVAPQYLVTDARRERMADYSRVPMPDFYFRRVARTLGVTAMSIPPGTPPAVVEQALAREVAKTAARDAGGLSTTIDRVAASVRAIEARGGMVVFVRLPSSGLVLALEERAFPRDRFWEPFAARVGAPAFHFADDPRTAAFTCPDGSHLDGRDAAPFTRALLDALADPAPRP